MTILRYRTTRKNYPTMSFNKNPITPEDIHATLRRYIHGDLTLDKEIEFIESMKDKKWRHAVITEGQK
ncbi:hypothetical protein COB64_01290 [Candidatus Wolfebacteria bacterium]|nr:MAG: hypothetical protein COB64_01290 [Candidatus Wolfebacteria bacterium]